MYENISPLEVNMILECKRLDEFDKNSNSLSMNIKVISSIEKTEIGFIQKILSLSQDNYFLYFIKENARYYQTVLNVLIFIAFKFMLHCCKLTFLLRNE